MPRLRRRSITRIDTASPRTVARLLTGIDFDMLDGVLLDDAELPAVWADLRDDLLVQADEMPWGFLECDEPYHRLPGESSQEAMNRLRGTAEAVPITRWPGYRVNDAGDVWDCRGDKPVKLHPYLNASNRRCVTLVREGARRLFIPLDSLDEAEHGFKLDASTEARLVAMLDAGESVDACSRLGVALPTVYAFKIAVACGRVKT